MTIATSVRGALSDTLRRVLESTTALDDATLYRSTSPTQPSIAFHLWHIARWMDYYRDALVGPNQQLWDREAFASRWNFDPAVLGSGSTGMGMGDDASAALELPPRAELLAYCRPAIDGLRETLASLTEAELEAEYTGHRAAEWAPQYGRVSVGATVITHLTHSNRHLGMIEALIGTMGKSGSATV